MAFKSHGKAHACTCLENQSKIGKSPFPIAGVTFAFGDLCGDGGDGWIRWRRTGGPGENNLGKRVPRFGAVCSIPAVYRLLSGPISSCFISFLLLLSFTVASVSLFVLSVGVSCEAVKVKRTLGH